MASLLISHNVNHLELAMRASTEADHCQASHPKRWDDRRYIPEHLAEPTVQRLNTPTEAPREEVQELPESRSHQVLGAGVTLQNPSSLAETQGVENSRRDNPLEI